MDNINLQLQKHLEFFSSNFLNSYNYIIGNCIYGSQNYKLSDENSDIDSILIYNGEKIFKKDRYNDFINYNNECIKIYNIDEFCNKLLYMNLSCLEIFCTKYKNIGNQNIKQIFENFPIDKFCENNLELLYYNLLKKLEEHTYEINHLSFFHEESHELMYNKKRLYWALRVYNQLSQLQSEKNFSTSLIPTNKDYILKVKQGISVPLEEVIEFRKKAFCKIKEELQQHPREIPKENKILIDKFRNDLLKYI